MCGRITLTSGGSSSTPPAPRASSHSRRSRSSCDCTSRMSRITPKWTPYLRAIFSRPSAVRCLERVGSASLASHRSVPTASGFPLGPHGPRTSGSSGKRIPSPTKRRSFESGGRSSASSLLPSTPPPQANDCCRLSLPSSVAGGVTGVSGRVGSSSSEAPLPRRGLHVSRKSSAARLLASSALSNVMIIAGLSSYGRTNPRCRSLSLSSGSSGTVMRSVLVVSSSIALM
mmetsp:Transcript_50459/g.161475  ORF Transcript_50459/g.161475 Transcript_50459/m.161475 type:complete len:229 (-) Transcript_50459:562-1248(-)